MPVVFHSLDVERKTKEVPCVICPVRRDLMAVGGCAYCSEFKCVEFDADSKPVLSCGRLRPWNAASRASRPRVVDVMRMPLIVTAADSPLDSVREYLELGCATDAIVVLDKLARPLGFVSVGQLRIAFGAMTEDETREFTLAALVDADIPCATPDTTLQAAIDLLARTKAPGLFVVSVEGMFLGSVSRTELDYGPQ